MTSKMWYKNYLTPWTKTEITGCDVLFQSVLGRDTELSPHMSYI